MTVTCAPEDPSSYPTGSPEINFDVPGIDVVAREKKSGRVEWRRNLYGVHDSPEFDPQQPPAMPTTVLPDGRVLLAHYGLVIDGSGMYCALRTLSPSDGGNVGSRHALPRIGQLHSLGCDVQLTGYRGLVVVTDPRGGTHAAIR